MCVRVYLQVSPGYLCVSGYLMCVRMYLQVSHVCTYVLISAFYYGTLLALFCFVTRSLLQLCFAVVC